MGEKCLWKIAGLMEDLFLGSQWSIILGYRRLSVKFLFFFTHSLFLFLFLTGTTFTSNHFLSFRYNFPILCYLLCFSYFGSPGFSTDFSSFSHTDNALELCGLLTPLHIVPEWYFLCQYAMLKAVPNKNAGFIILLTSIFTFFL